ncbi:MAG: hypothetical protein WA956_11095 [Stenotrophomonas sp.]
MRLSMVLPVLLLAGCATSPVAEEAKPVSSIGQRLLVPESGGGQPGQVQPYELSGREVFRMPEPLHAPLPELPALASRQSLPPVTVCLNVIVDAHGQVQRGFPLLTHSQCGAGNDAGNAALLQAAIDAVRNWRFRPAAICRFAPGVLPAAAEDCAGAGQVEEVPVTLPYAFTFEVVQGQAQVRLEQAPR